MLYYPKLFVYFYTAVVIVNQACCEVNPLCLAESQKYPSAKFETIVSCSSFQYLLSCQPTNELLEQLSELERCFKCQEHFCTLKKLTLAYGGNQSEQFVLTWGRSGDGG